MMGRHARITLPIDTVIIHGRPELALVKQSEKFRQRTGARLVRSDRPDYDLRAAALGLALANSLADNTGVDLSRTLKPPVSIVEVLPYGELLLHTRFWARFLCSRSVLRLRPIIGSRRPSAGSSRFPGSRTRISPNSTPRKKGFRIA